MSQKKILLVDDEPNILLSLQFLLEQAGLLVISAERANTALALAKKEAPNLAILDVMMPGMDGFELAKQLRSLPEMEQLQIVFLTARGTTQDKQEGYKSGGEVYITKPFDNQDLVNTILELLTYG